MTYILHIGDRAYSSWSLRGWLMFDAFGIDVRTHDVPLYEGNKDGALGALAPARLVPVLDLPDRTRIQDTLAIAETLAERHPEAGLWPDDPAARATARWLVAEMHSGFGDLRRACPMNLRRLYSGFVPDAGTKADLERIEVLWAHARQGRATDWLFGHYSLADVFYAPVAARIAGYSLSVGESAQAYVERHLRHPSFVAWHEAAARGPEAYALDLPWQPWQAAR